MTHLSLYTVISNIKIDWEILIFYKEVWLKDSYILKLDEEVFRYSDSEDIIELY